MSIYLEVPNGGLIQYVWSNGRDFSNHSSASDASGGRHSQPSIRGMAEKKLAYDDLDQVIRYKLVYPFIVRETHPSVDQANLERKLSPNMEEYAVEIKDQLRETKKTDDLPMIDYLLYQIQALSDNLVESGLEIREREVTGFALEGLPVEFDTFVTIVNAQKNLTFDDVHHI